MINPCDEEMFPGDCCGAVPGIQAIFNFPYGHIVMAHILIHELVEQCYGSILFGFFSFVSLSKLASV